MRDKRKTVETRIEGRKAFLALCFQTFLLPEIKKDEPHRKIQVIIDPHGEKEILYEDDIHKLIGFMQLREGIEKQENDPIFTHELVRGKDNVQIFDAFIPKKEDCLHITAIQDQGDWKIFTNFIFNKKTAEKYVENAENFLLIAQYAADKGKVAPYAVNIFKAIELALMAFIIVTPYIDSTKGTCRPFYANNPNKTWRKKTFKKFKRFIQFGYLPEDYIPILEELYSLRDDLGYIKKYHDISAKKMVFYLEKAEFAIKQLRKTVFERERYREEVRQQDVIPKEVEY